MESKSFWIKERHNPQLGVYYVAMGRLSKTAAKRHSRSVYGQNVMHEFATEKSYNGMLAELRGRGDKVQNA